MSPLMLMHMTPPTYPQETFYRAVMHSSHLSLTIRMDAAAKLMRIEAAEPQSVILHDEAQPLYKIIIGGLPDEWFVSSI